jgi:predicted permease
MLDELKSKRHVYVSLFVRVLLPVLLINSIAFYEESLHMQFFIDSFFETIALITLLTLFVLTINVAYWCKYVLKLDDRSSV